MKPNIDLTEYPPEIEDYHQEFASDKELRSSIEKFASNTNYQAAITLLDLLLQRHPDSAIDYNNRGLMYLRQGELTSALADLDRAIAINPKLDSAYNNRANCHAQGGNLAQALADYEIALDLNPGNIRAWINQGITFRQLGLYDLAIENFDLTLLLSKRLQGRIYAERGRTYHLRGDWNLAVGDYQRALQYLLSKRGHLSNYKQQVETWLSSLLNPITA